MFDCLLSGAAAGLAVDLTLYPLDTIKTRLQSSAGFRQSGAFGRLYAGLPSVVVGSAPGSAVFFVVYETIKRSTTSWFPAMAWSHVLAASAAELAACVVRVPTEVIKQRTQAGVAPNVANVFRTILAREGVAGFYRGFYATIVREIPFSIIQFPIWEYLKRRWSIHSGRTVISPWETALCGSIAGGIAGAMTTPLDVTKTRMMLSLTVHDHRDTVLSTLKDVWSSRGIRGLFAGLLPRVLWLSVGGFVFFGAYSFFLGVFGTQSFISPVDLMDKDAGGYRIYTLIERWLKWDNLLPDQQRTFDDVLKEAEELRARRQRWSTVS